MAGQQPGARCAAREAQQRTHRLFSDPAHMFPPTPPPDGPAAKKPKLTDVAADAAPEAADADAAPAPVDVPVAIGYKTFATGADAAKYFYTIINSVTHGQDLNEVRRR